MKKHIALIIFISLSSILYPVPLSAGKRSDTSTITETQKKEAKSMLVAELQHAYKQLHKKSLRYTKKYVPANELRDVEHLNQVATELQMLLHLSGLLTNTTTPTTTNMLLLAAAEKNNVTGVNAALKLGADVNTQNESGQTAAMFAAYHGNESLFQLLKHAGANIRLIDDSGRTALMYRNRIR